MNALELSDVRKIYTMGDGSDVVALDHATLTVADDEIVKRLKPGDLVITSDIPLAAAVIDKGGHALSPRGEMHTTENIGARLNMRDFLDTMRSSGVEMGSGPASFSQRDKQTFANEVDRFLTKHF